MVIVLRPTRRKERFNGVEYRVYEGNVPALDGLRVEMLGMFRIYGSQADKEKFERMVASVSPGDPPVVTLLSDQGLSRP